MDDKYFNSIVKAIEQSDKAYNIELLRKAYDLAKTSHLSQIRDTGDPYISHPVSVAIILVELGMDMESILGALLHDIVEDTPVTLKELEHEFGGAVALLVDGVTKLGKVSLTTREERQAENVRKMLIAMNEDIRVIIIKLADRLHNMRTLYARPPQKQRDTSKETMDIYAPIAHRLGIRGIKEELEDLALRYLDPIGYEEIEILLESKKEDRSDFLGDIMKRIRERLDGDSFHAEIGGRVKSVYGIYRKMYMQGKTFEEIYDIYAVRVIVDSVFECYNVFGLMHDMFTPIPNRFKDYISTPKPNMYQSLHTTVIGKEGIPFEIQIRTFDMHHTAEFGIAAHWKYKAGITKKNSLEERISWIRQLLESEDEDVENIVKNIKTDLAPEEVFVFTPKGDVKVLPAGSTIIDFAYSIHSEVGNRLVGAKVNSRMMSIDYEVQTGDIIEILLSNAQGQGPSRDWLNIAKTSSARSKIRSWFKRERREENIDEGKSDLEREFRRNRINLDADQEEEFIEDLAKRQKCASVDDFYASIGYGGIQLSKIMQRVKEDYIKKYRQEDEPVESIVPRRSSRKVSSGVIVEGVDGLLVKFSQCCNPVPGDEIIGFITRGYGVSIHKQDCINVTSAFEKSHELERWVGAKWANEVKETFKVTLEMVVSDRPGLLADISIQLANMHLPLHELNARELQGKCAGITLTIEIVNLEQLKNIISSLSRIQGTLSVKRTGK